MEAIFKILKQLMGTAGVLGSVPKPIKLGMTYLGVCVGVLIIFKYAKLDQSEKTFLIIAVVVLAIITAGYFAWKGWMQKQQNQQFGGDLSQHSSKTPVGIDAGQRARLDDMRKKFQSGVEAYKSRGKDLYKLPWYAMVGEPGSGKTEAIRHSNVGFPPGMQDEFQGVGGTINMNWWFTNHAVLLDTAGRLMFEDVKPGETSEWQQFLTLLKKNRPNCPINGLFLVIPSDSLIKDSADAIQKKAGKIAQQLDVIQRVLDVRFPVFIVVTKCDKINGFREFFDGLTDPQLQHQMMGWSNPDPLDEPFKAELVEKHLEQVAARLRRRRLGLLRDPVPETSDGRRTDDVDSLYSLPHSLELLSSRLRRYLETIFIAGEWSAKPLFLRGIYFSSSMREGSALDAELAEAIGVGVEDLPEGKVWERERAYFLRDLFVEKVFREKGLVTSASNTKRMLRSQQIALYGFGFASLVLFSVVAWFAKGKLSAGVEDQGKYWRAVRAAGWEDKYWKQSIVPILGDGSFASTLSTNPVLVDNKPVALGEFQQKLRDKAEKPLPKNFMFPWLAAKYDKDSRKAQRIVFETGIVGPLVGAARQKMKRDEAQAGSPPFQPDALVGLIRLEADILSRGTGIGNVGELNQERARTFLGAFENYLEGKEAPVDTNLVAVMTWTYSTNAAADGWAPRCLSGGHGGANTLAVNDGIKAGLELFIRNATASFQKQLADWGQISNLSASVETFAAKENALFKAAPSAEAPDLLKAPVAAVEAARKELDDQITNASSHPLFTNGMSLINARQRFQTGVSNSAIASLGRVRNANNAALAATKGAALFQDIKTQLDAVEGSLTDRVAQLLRSGDSNELKRLDENYLAGRGFATRADLYTEAEKLSGEKLPAGGIGSKGKPLEEFLTNRIGTIETKAAAYSGKLKNELTDAVASQLKLMKKKQSDAFFADYLAQAKPWVANAQFPLVRNGTPMLQEDKFKETATQLKKISVDLASPVFQKYAVSNRLEWKPFVAGVEGQEAMARALLADDGSLGVCTISLAAMTDAAGAKDDWRQVWYNMKLIRDRGDTEPIRTDERTDKEIGNTPIDQTMKLVLIKNASVKDSPTFPLPTEGPRWGPLWLIHQYNGERDKKDPSAWLVEFPIKPPGATGAIRLKLKFERPLPALDQWPAK